MPFLLQCILFNYKQSFHILAKHKLEPLVENIHNKQSPARFDNIHFWKTSCEISQLGKLTE